jgi:ElaB/YqjD/DUF883 family membrane-anchored ribosome-binding protein
MQRVNSDRLVRDLCAVAADVDELVKSTTGNANEAIVEARERVAGSLRTARQNLESARLCAVGEGASVARSADAYVRENAWKAMCVAGGIGLLLGAIVGLKSRSPRTPRD